MASEHQSAVATSSLRLPEQGRRQRNAGPGAQHGPSGPSARRPPIPWRQYGLFIALTAPNVALILVFGYWPVVYNVILSLQRWDMISPMPEFIGLDNWVALFTTDDLGRIMFQTFVLLISVTLGSLALGLGMALLLDQRLFGRRLGRTLAFAPYVIGSATTAMIWLFLFDPNFGLIKSMLGMVGLESPRWMSDAAWAMPAMIIVHIWRHAGFVAIIYIAGLQSIPRELKEAAIIDGAGAWHRFTNVTAPLLTPVTYFLLVTTVISTFQAFDLIAIMTGGGPGTATQVLSWHIYELGFVRSNAGLAGASATMMFVLLLVITALQTRFVRRSVNDT